MVRWCVETEQCKNINGAMVRWNEQWENMNGAMVRCFSIFTCARQRKDGERLDEFDDWAIPRAVRTSPALGWLCMGWSAVRFKQRTIAPSYHRTIYVFYCQWKTSPSAWAGRSVRRLVSWPQNVWADLLFITTWRKSLINDEKRLRNICVCEIKYLTL